MVGIGQADDGAGRAVGPVQRQQNRRSLRGLHELDVLDVLAERKIPLARLFQAGAGRNLDVLAFQVHLERFPDLIPVGRIRCSTVTDPRRPVPIGTTFDRHTDEAPRDAAARDDFVFGEIILQRSLQFW